MCILGNHDYSLKKFLSNLHTKFTDQYIAKTIAEIKGENNNFKEEILKFLSRLTPYLILEGEKLVVTHAAIKSEYIDTYSKKVYNFCLYGDNKNIYDPDSWGYKIILN